MVDRLEIAESALKAIVAHARETAPLECCGLLVGRGGRVDETVRTQNALASPTRYQVAPEDHFAVIRRCRLDGLAIVAAYHSHPQSAAAPSERDVAEAHDSRLVYVIVSLADWEAPEVRAFWIRDGGFGAIPMVVD